MLFSAVVLVSYFCAEIKYRKKFKKKHNKSFWTKRLSEPEGDLQGAHRPHTTPRRGQGAAPRGCLLSWSVAWGCLFACTFPPDLKTTPRRIFPETLPSSAAIQNPNSGDRIPVPALCRDGDLEEIVAIIITNTSPSIIHDSSIHV